MFSHFRTAIFAVCLIGLAGRSDQFSDQDLLEGRLPPNYNRAITPIRKAGEAVQVQVSMHILDMSEISDITGDYKISFYLRHKWNDPRLQFEPTAFNNFSSAVHAQPETMSRIWRPDTFFANAKHVEVQQLAMINHDATFCRIISNGTIFMSKLLTIEAFCPMSGSRFPFDHQQCSIEMESYGYSTDNINYVWRNSGIGISDNVPSINFRLIGFRADKRIESLSSGNYSRLIVKFNLARRSCSYIVKYILPIAILTLLSFTTFSVLDSAHAHARVAKIAFSATIFIALIIFSTVSGTLRTSFNYIDFYAAISTIFALFSLLKSAFCPGNRCQTDSLLAGQPINSDKCDKSVGGKCRQWIIPAIYVIFNVVYAIVVAFQ